MFQSKKEHNDLSSPTGGQGAGCIILAGGLGTRLRPAVPDLPKCMAPVGERPFLYYVINHFRMQGVQHFVFSLGYKAEVILNYLEENYPTLNYDVVIEEEPLGTGGAIHLAIQKTTFNNVFIANGDTLFKVNASEVFRVHQNAAAECTLSLKALQNLSRYGVVEMAENGRLSLFKEKQFYKDGLINGGVYLLNKQAFLKHSFPKKFSFEQDYLEKYYGEEKFFGSVQNEYFIDIGIPEDYEKAGKDLKQRELDLTKIDKTWTLFLDRDGVINNELPGTYVLKWEQFIFSTGALNSFQTLADCFGKIIVVSNQRGIGKELMSEHDLLQIHAQMQREIETAGGRIDAIYFCTDVNNASFHRKPNPGMVVQALTDFPDIDVSKSIMVGNKPGDMQFGRFAGMFTVFITSTNPTQPFPHNDIDAIFPSLAQFAQAVQS